MSTDLTSERRTADRLDIADTMYRYAEAMDHIGAHPVERGAPDPALAQATEILRTCMTDDAIVRLYFHGPVDEPVQAGPGGPVAFAPFVREYFTAYGYVQTYHLVGNVRPTFTGPNTALVRSYINSTHWMADGRFLLAPIEYDDAVVRGVDGLWRIRTREIVVWRWWVTDGYAPVPTDPNLARPVQVRS
jgi:hypothetical protein